jgi:hypothetical protein
MKHNDDDMDVLLRRALGSTETPSAGLVQSVKYKLAVSKSRKHGARLSIRMVAVAVIAVMLVTSTALAAWGLLKPSEIAERFGNEKLEAAFESEDAVVINESVTSGDYTFTLLGVVSGKDITDGFFYSNGALVDDRTYAVVAIQKADGTPMPGPRDSGYDEMEFFATPLVKGLNPIFYNAASMNGGYSETIIDGIVYRLTECDRFDIFADRGLYFAIYTDSFSDLDALVYNEQTGEIAANPDYDGACAVFDLPVDPKLADPEKAEQYLKFLDTQWTTQASAVYAP